MIMLATALTVVAIVAADQTALRAAPRDSAAQQAVLWQGDSLEIRGEKGDFLQVYDHRRERAGYIRTTQVRVQSLKPEAAPELLAVLRFLKEAPGSEALGVAYAAAYLRAAPAEAIGPEIFDALGVMSDRLARRASAGRSGKPGEATAAHLEVVAAYGVTMTTFERDGQVQLCANGDPQRRVLALPSTDIQKAIAALALTRHECVSPALTPVERYALDQWRTEVLDRVELAKLPEVLKNRIRLRSAGVWASLAYQRARRPELGMQAVQEAANRAIDHLAAINKTELMETDAAAYSDAAIRVGASRWSAVPATPASTGKAAKLTVVTSPGQPGETCVALVDAKHDAGNPLASRCTYGIVWPASAAANADGSALALAVQTGDTWREMWVFKKQANGWSVDILPPGLDTPNLGYVEFAGWVPGGKEMLAAREVKVDGRYRQSFEVLSLATLETRKAADRPASLSTFYRWQSPLWKAGTIAVR
ncbi:MAG TPA: hypothetical protein PKD04_01300 [Rhodocyclaceae bacterium]|jgi:hypothetical protein|nr:hypothetical protein [Rhodocyclaceae bacterium]HMV21341.1 hypothetical protein [Rhodocyclaceae bacterium]HMW76170.1 hypothetical protein [Rhodocyclaceae bacterium]HNP03499.1 hypothetical protein [Rhodocyclaceae bacterium]